MAKNTGLKWAGVGLALYLIFRKKEKAFTPFDLGDKLWGKGAESVGKPIYWADGNKPLSGSIGIIGKDGNPSFAYAALTEKGTSYINIPKGTIVGYVDKIAEIEQNGSITKIIAVKNPIVRTYYDDGKEAKLFYFINPKSQASDYNLVYI